VGDAIAPQFAKIPNAHQNGHEGMVKDADGEHKGIIGAPAQEDEIKRQKNEGQSVGTHGAIIQFWVKMYLDSLVLLSFVAK
jgi:hypothetical protein